MGFHICITNEDIIDINLSLGVYGNVGRSGESKRTLWSKIKDLYAIKPGDLILLYVKSPRSQFHGVFEVTTFPYICSDNLFQNSEEKYPLRFEFKRKLFFPNPIPSFEFYSLVESGIIESMITLSRDMNSSYRGIRQLFESEYQEILQLFYKYNPKTIPDQFEQINPLGANAINIEAKDFDVELINDVLSPVSLILTKYLQLLIRQFWKMYYMHI
jgi:hypothetical protein